MILDLKIEIFAYNLFYDTWINMGLTRSNLDIIQILGEECCKVENCEEVCDKLFAIAVRCRRKMFGRIYLADFTDETAKSLKSLSEVYDFIISTCNRDDLFGHLTVFERMFATCSFVIDLCVRIDQYNKLGILKYGHMLWAMYFEKYADEFYEEGGWNQLKEVGRPYLKIYVFLLFFEETEFNTLNMAIEEYFDFIDNDQYEEYKYKLKKIHVSKLWVKHRIERFKSCIKIPLLDQYFVDSSEMDELLENLKCLFENFLNKNAFFIDSETPDEYDIYLQNLNADERLFTNETAKYLSYRKSPPHSAPNKTNIVAEKDENNSFESAYIEKIFKDYCSLKKGDQQMETPKSTEIISTNKMEKSESNGNSFSGIHTRHVEEILHYENQKKQNESPIVAEASENNINVSLYYRKPPPYSVSNTTNFFSEKTLKGSVEEIGTEKASGVNCALKRVDDHKEIPIRTEIMSKSPTTKPESRKSYLDLHPNRHVSEMYIDNLSVRKGETLPATETLAENQMDALLSYRKPPQYIDLDKTTLISEKRGNAEKVRIENAFEVNCSSKNGEGHWEIEKETEVISLSQNAKSHINEKNAPNMLLLPKVFNSKNRCGNINDKMDKIEQAHEYLRNEQDDYAIKIFLRMILVLSDRDGTKFVMQALLNNAVVPRNLQKKKSKKNKPKKRFGQTF